MRRQRERDTGIEIELRRILHRLGLRFRLHAKVPDVPRLRPDVVFPSEKVAVFVDGCFWHKCPQHHSLPKANRRWWLAKLDANVERDRRQGMELATAGWEVLRIWEHEDLSAAADRVERTVRGRRQ
ncbi:MAG TPA: very short patch repair endonuclease [Acidimicrobiia bacterium]|nr:very short patch repair endonuclease [Acidimicrobiia bacterium]